MSKIDKKLEQIKLQHDISELLREDNGVSCHFDYHVNLLSDNETVKLNVLTYNQRHNEYMLLHTVTGTSSIDCLGKTKSYLISKSTDVEEYSYSVKWKKAGDAKEYTSYFVGSSQEEVELKFLHEKNIEEYSYEIIQNPVA